MHKYLTPEQLRLLKVIGIDRTDKGIIYENDYIIVKTKDGTSVQITSGGLLHVL